MPRLGQFQPIPGSSANVVASSSGGGLLRASLAASTAGKQHDIVHVGWAVTTPLATQTLTIYKGTSSGTAIYEMGIISSGRGTLDFAYPVRGGVNTAVTVVLSSGSTGLQTLSVYSLSDD